ncbi:hypothetical protein, partial [Agrococcus terreus]|uniref:hypothetical protein n=1 Tax=Agrococcus terreus TaxID=574649 RepID=UPI0031D505ED
LDGGFCAIGIFLPPSMELCTASQRTLYLAWLEHFAIPRVRERDNRRSCRGRGCADSIRIARSLGLSIMALIGMLVDQLLVLEKFGTGCVPPGRSATNLRSSFWTIVRLETIMLSAAYLLTENT